MKQKRSEGLIRTGRVAWPWLWTAMLRTSKTRTGGMAVALDGHAPHEHDMAAPSRGHATHHLSDCDPLSRAAGLLVVVAAVLLMAGGVEAFGQRLAQSAGPAGRAMPGPSAVLPPPGADIATVWNEPPQTTGPRGSGTLLYDNGQPIEDWGDPASQLSNVVAEPWQFIAAAADDFILPTTGLPERDFHITSIRAPFSCWNSETGEICETSQTPALWRGIQVTVYPNSGTNAPAGWPKLDGTLEGTWIATQYVAVSFLTFTSAGHCHPLHTVDIPVNFVLPKGTRYWLSLVPNTDAPPQTFWCLSNDNKNFHAERGSDFDYPFWIPIEGNSQNTDLCPDPLPPPAGTKLDLSFQIYGEELSPTVGACCHTDTGVCMNGITPSACSGQYMVFHPGAACEFLSPPCAVVTGACCDDSSGSCDSRAINACQGPTQRFSAGKTCAQLQPPCGTATDGACCKPNRSCEDLSPTECSAAGGVWHDELCAAFQCPPENDHCDNVITITNGSTSFDTLGADTDGPAINPRPPACAEVNQDVWFRYVATCDGMVVASLCQDADYDSSMAVYQGCVCPPNLGPQVACDNDHCGAGGAGGLIAGQIAEASYRHYLDDVLYTHDGDNRDAKTGPDHDPAREAIFTILQSFNLQVEKEAFTYNSATHYNVVATQLGTVHPDEYYVVGAHYDSYHTPGADDNGSGVAGVLEIARVLHAYQTDYTIKYVAFDVEEYGLYGSEAYVAAHLTDGILGMVSMDMIAHDPSMNLANVRGKAASNPIMETMRSAVLLYGDGLGARLQSETSSRSDHGPFQDAGIQACELSEPDIDEKNPCYHHACDSVDNPDPTYMSYPFAVKMTRSAAGFLADAAVVHVGLSKASEVAFQAANGQCYMIRVGGVGAATGSGTLNIRCTPANTGACCHANQNCDDDVAASACTAPGDHFFEGWPCSSVDCPSPTEGACCDRFTGVCTDVEEAAACAGDYQEFHLGAKCRLLSPPCEPLKGACCDDTSGTCTENVAINACQGPAQRFSAGMTCLQLLPLCGTLGACCLPGQSCQDRTQGVCTSLGGSWHSGSCAGPTPYQCPPDNDLCVNRAVAVDGPQPFNTLGATTDGPAINPQAGCAEVNQDVWFLYTASCTGVLEISLCGGTAYDSAIAVYTGSTCPTSPGTQIACDNDGCGTVGGLSKVSLSVAAGSQYLIRIGGVGTATGSGIMTITCTPAWACCRVATGDCELALEAQCLPPDIFKEGMTCAQAHCPPAPRTCCAGDNNSDGTIDGRDIQKFVERFLTAPPIGTIAFCEADVNRDYQIDMADLTAFVDELLDAPNCPPPPVMCCRGDTNGDGKLDGLDVQGLVDALLNPPAQGSLVFCRADVNDDRVINELDVLVLVGKLTDDVSDECPPPAFGACCNTWFGECRIEYSPDNCVWGGYEVFYPGANCLSVTCQEQTGACCDDATGTCTDGVAVSACLVSPSARFGEGQTCATLNPQCTGPITGACCDDATGTCTDNVEQGACQGPTQRFGEGQTCASLTPPCTGPITCCHGDTDGNGLLNGDDIQGVVNAILADPPLSQWTVEFCRADVNADNVIDEQDAVALTLKLIPGDSCSP